MTVLKLIDPASNQEVFITQAQLNQRCDYCDRALLGEWIIATKSRHWVCLEHYPQTLGRLHQEMQT